MERKETSVLKGKRKALKDQDTAFEYFLLLPQCIQMYVYLTKPILYEGEWLVFPNLVYSVSIKSYQVVNQHLLLIDERA